MAPEVRAFSENQLQRSNKTILRLLQLVYWSWLGLAGLGAGH